MGDSALRQEDNLAVVQVWGKGYRVTEDSEEFQRYVPSGRGRVSDFEEKRLALPWGSVLAPLYSLDARDLSAQRCVLFDTSEMMSIAVAPTEDKHNRPSLILVTATTGISWSAANLGETAARLVHLSSRLAIAYAGSMRGNPERIGQQMRSDKFLPNRSFSLPDEETDLSFEWDYIFAAIKRWRGIAGVCTSRLVSLGANIVLGTNFEAEKMMQESPVDGYFDVRDREIKSLTQALTPWSAQVPVKSKPAEVPIDHRPEIDLTPVVESLDRIERTFIAFADGVLEVLNRLVKDKRKK